MIALCSISAHVYIKYFPIVSPFSKSCRKERRGKIKKRIANISRYQAPNCSRSKEGLQARNPQKRQRPKPDPSKLKHPLENPRFIPIWDLALDDLGHRDSMIPAFDYAFPLSLSLSRPLRLSNIGSGQYGMMNYVDWKRSRVLTAL